MIPMLPEEGEVPERFSLSYPACQVKPTCDKMHLKTMHNLKTILKQCTASRQFYWIGATTFQRLVGSAFSLVGAESR